MLAGILHLILLIITELFTSSLTKHGQDKCATACTYFVEIYQVTFWDLTQRFYFWRIERGDSSSEPIKSIQTFHKLLRTGYCVSLDWPANWLTGGSSHKRQLLFSLRHDIVIKGYDSLLIDSSWNGTMAGWLPIAVQEDRERPKTEETLKPWRPTNRLFVGPTVNSRLNVLGIS